MLLEEGFVLFRSNELAVGKESRAKFPVLEFVAKFVVADTQAHAVRLGNQSLLIDKLLGSLAGKIRHQHAGLRSAAGHLLPEHGPGFALHLGHGHRLIANRGHNARWRSSDAEVGAEPGNERDRHRGANED